MTATSDIAIIYAMGAAAFCIYVHQHPERELAGMADRAGVTFLFTNLFEWAVHNTSCTAR